MSAESYISEDNFKPIFDVLVVLNKKIIALERNHLNLCEGVPNRKLNSENQHTFNGI
jgi:hypothetical protein